MTVRPAVCLPPSPPDEADTPRGGRFDREKSKRGVEDPFDFQPLRAIDSPCAMKRFGARGPFDHETGSAQRRDIALRVFGHKADFVVKKIDVARISR